MFNILFCDFLLKAQGEIIIILPQGNIPIFTTFFYFLMFSFSLANTLMAKVISVKASVQNCITRIYTNRPAESKNAIIFVNVLSV